MAKILVTGAAGFIGFHVVKKLLKEGFSVIGIDNLNNYYDVRVKLDRLASIGIENKRVAYNEPIQSSKHSQFSFVQMGIEDSANLERLFSKYQFEKVCHLAAQAGVRYSIKHPEAYIQSNIIGFFNILESCRHHSIKHLVYASSSSVYGNSRSVPFKTEDVTDTPISFYAATKKSNELMAHTYSHLFNLQTTGLRFFTVYGPWGRPDMAYSLFTKAMVEGDPIKIFNNGQLSRDFTYIDDIVDGIFLILNSKKDAEEKQDNYKIYNIGHSKPTSLLKFIETIEKALGVEAKKEFLPMQPGDVETTYADVSDLMKDFGYCSKTGLEEGIGKFVEWYKAYNKVKI